jgi:hypothetical protein
MYVWMCERVSEWLNKRKNDWLSDLINECKWMWLNERMDEDAIRIIPLG